MTTAILKAIDRPKYNDGEVKGRLARLSGFIVKCGQRKGLGVSPKAAMQMALLLDEDISSYFGPSLSMDEVVLALDWGTHGEFGEFTGLNADRLFSYVKDYSVCEERVVAVKQHRREREFFGKRVPLYEINVRNWDAMADETLSNWRDYVSGYFRPYKGNGKGEDPRVDVLIIAHRHVLSGCYRWLKSMGMVIEDESLPVMERECMDAAEKAFPDSIRLQRVLAEAMMLENFFLAAFNSGFDLEGGVLGAKEHTADERKDYMKWRGIGQ